MGGRNSVMPEKTLDKAALEQYLDGGFKVESIIYQVGTSPTRGGGDVAGPMESSNPASGFQRTPAAHGCDIARARLRVPHSASLSPQTSLALCGLRSSVSVVAGLKA